MFSCLLICQRASEPVVGACQLYLTLEAPGRTIFLKHPVSFFGSLQIIQRNTSQPLAWLPVFRGPREGEGYHLSSNYGRTLLPLFSERVLTLHRNRCPQSKDSVSLSWRKPQPFTRVWEAKHVLFDSIFLPLLPGCSLAMFCLAYKLSFTEVCSSFCFLLFSLVAQLWILLHLMCAETPWQKSGQRLWIGWSSQLGNSSG